MNDFSDALKDFVAFFTVKHIAVVLLVLICLVLVCSPRQDTTEEQLDCVGDTCPMRHK